jgi:hypothetical protein
MKIIPLNADQKAKIAALKSAADAAQKSASAARQALNDYVAGITGTPAAKPAPKGKRFPSQPIPSRRRNFQISDDGASLVIG